MLMKYGVERSDARTRISISLDYVQYKHAMLMVY